MARKPGKQQKEIQQDALWKVLCYLPQRYIIILLLQRYIMWKVYYYIYIQRDYRKYRWKEKNDLSRQTWICDEFMRIQCEWHGEDKLPYIGGKGKGRGLAVRSVPSPNGIYLLYLLYFLIVNVSELPKRKNKELNNLFWFNKNRNRFPCVRNA